MSINLRILVPESTTNYILNPSPRYATTGWNAVGSTVTRVLTRSRWSIASLQVVTTGASLNEGTFFRVSDLSGIQDWVTASVYVRGAGKVRIRLINNPNGAEWTGDPIALTDERWTRIEVSGRCNGSNDMRLYVETADLTAKAITFYVDGAQMERKPYATTYVDGSQPGCRWNIQAYATQSTRDDSSRAGGRWVALAGPCRPNNDIYVTLLGGLGMASIQNQTQPWSNSPGSFFQNSKVRDRTLTLSFFVKKEDLYPSGPPDLTPLHEMRQQIIDIVKPDATGGDEAFLFEYESTEANRKLYIRARYDGGLDGSWDVRNQWVNAFPVRLLAVDPFWFEDDQEVALLGMSTTYPQTTTGLFARKENQWIQIRNSLGHRAYAPVIVEHPSGAIYFAGVTRTTPGSGTIILSYGLIRWDGKEFTKVGDITGGTVEAMTVGLNGVIYITGIFTGAGGVAVSNIAMYNPETGVWSALGTGINSTGQDIVCADNGQIYVGGNFTMAGGISCLRIARWDGSQWRTVGATSGVDAPVLALVKARDGKTLYMGGVFDKSNGNSVTYNRVASIDTTTNLLSQMGSGISDDVIPGEFVEALGVGLDGRVYAGGGFLTSASGAPLLKVAQWSGGRIWLPMGGGFAIENGGTSVSSFGIGKNGEIYVSGSMKQLANGEVIGSGLVKWLKDTWQTMEVFQNVPPASIGIDTTVVVHSSGDIYINLDSFFTMLPSQTVISNPGTAAVFPLLYYKDAGTIRYIGNVRTGQAIYLDLTVFDDEEIFFDFARGKIMSTVRGDVSYSILPGSEIRSIYCLPGENTFSVLVTNDVNGIMQLRLQPQHWSVDAVVEAEEL